MEQHVEMAALKASLGLWPMNTDRREVYGTGSPEGVVTANPSTYYTDTAGTVGAWRWLKTSGTGNTGWTVVDGDTGWRNVTSDLISVTGVDGIYLKRRLDLVTVLIRFNANIAAAGAITTNPISTGFSPIAHPKAAAWRPLAPIGRATQTGWLTITSGNENAGPAILASTITATASSRAEATWATDAAWPTTLPGTAA